MTEYQYDKQYREKIMGEVFQAIMLASIAPEIQREDGKRQSVIRMPEIIDALIDTAAYLTAHNTDARGPALKERSRHMSERFRDRAKAMRTALDQGEVHPIAESFDPVKAH